MQRTVEQAGELVRKGGVVAAPTETFYALVASARDRAASERIFRIKVRDGVKPLPVVAADKAAVEASFEIPPMCEAAMHAFWPGPLTLVLRPKGHGLEHLQSELGTVAVRVSPNQLITRIAELAGGLVTSTSANLSGEPPVSRVDELDPVLVAGLDGVVDGGQTPGGLASTIAEWGEAGWVVYREGPITRAALEGLGQ